jgi:DNA replication protein DnaC
MQAVADILAAMNMNQPPRMFDDEQPATKRQIERRTLAELDTANPSVKAAVEMCRRWAQRKRDGHTDASIILCGPVGTGKTHIAKAVLWSMAYTLDDGTAVGYAGKFFVASDLISLLSPTRNDYGVTETPRPAQFIGNAPIVVIDDVGSEGTIAYIKTDDETQAAEIQARYFRVVDYCYSWNVSLVITSNLSIPQLAQHVGRRSWDRLGQMAPAGFMIDMTGVPSWRQRMSGR